MNIYDALSLLSVAVMFFGIFRVHWVFKKRMKVLRCMGLITLNTMPSYNTMMLKFWVWDINKFLK